MDKSTYIDRLINNSIEYYTVMHDDNWLPKPQVEPSKPIVECTTLADWCITNPVILVCAEEVGFSTEHIPLYKGVSVLFLNDGLGSVVVDAANAYHFDDTEHIQYTIEEHLLLIAKYGKEPFESIEDLTFNAEEISPTTPVVFTTNKGNKVQLVEAREFTLKEYIEKLKRDDNSQLTDIITELSAIEFVD